MIDLKMNNTHITDDDLKEICMNLAVLAAKNGSSVEPRFAECEGLRIHVEERVGRYRFVLYWTSGNKAHDGHSQAARLYITYDEVAKYVMELPTE